MLSFLIIFALSSSFLCEYYVSTFAGSGNAKYEDGQDVHASFSYPSGVAADAFGNVFIADSGNARIRKINSTGYVSTFAGNGHARYSDGQSGSASFNDPSDLTIDLFGNIFVADSRNNMIRKINASGYVSTLAGNGSASSIDGQGIYVTFNYPKGVTVDLFGNILVSDFCKIRRINSTGFVSTIAGNSNSSFSDGNGFEASFNSPRGITVDLLGNIFIADYGNARIRRINSTGYVSTLAGNGSNSFCDGKGAEATFSGPDGITIDSNGNLFVSDSGNQKIRKIDPISRVNTFAGTDYGFLDGPESIAMFSFPQGITVDANGTIFVVDFGNQRIRKISFSALNSVRATVSATESLIATNSIFTLISPTNSFSSVTESNGDLSKSTFVAAASLSSMPSTIKQNSQISIIFLKPEYIYSAIIGMFLVAAIVVVIFIVTTTRKPKVNGKRKRLIQHLEMRRKIELIQRQKSLPRNQFQRKTRK